MADLGPFGKVISKHAGRAKERILQNLGKADKTTDEEFDLHVKNFNRQQNAAMKLQKEFKNYQQCLRTMQVARKSLMDSFGELYEPCWIGTHEFVSKSEESNRNFEQFCDEMESNLVTSVGDYLAHFPEFTTKISKRSRKLLDYDNSRHNLQNLESMKKREEPKISKAKDHLDNSFKNFEMLNSELHDELPELYNSRVMYFATTLQSLFTAEAKFHEKDSSTFFELNGILAMLEKDSLSGSKGSFGKGHSTSLDSTNEFTHSAVSTQSDSCVLSTTELTESVLSADYQSAEGLLNAPVKSVVSSEKNLTLEMVEGNMVENVVNESPSPVKIVAPAKEKMSDGNLNCEKSFIKMDHETGDTPDLSILYKVKSTYKYVAEDADELSFNVGDVIDVIPYDDPEEQEDGWLMGFFDGKKGLFPANFTSRI